MRALALTAIVIICSCGPSEAEKLCEGAEQCLGNNGCDFVCRDHAKAIGTCCECLVNTSELVTGDPCIPVSQQTCEDGGQLSAQCYCWEQCFTYCDPANYYPYDEPPNGCQHG